MKVMKGMRSSSQDKNKRRRERNRKKKLLVLVLAVQVGEDLSQSKNTLGSVLSLLQEK